jgi:flagellar M-ring protein FliF
MPTLDRQSFTERLSGIRTGIDRLRRAMMARSPAVRVGLALALVLGVVAAGYFVVVALVPSGTHYLASGRLFSAEDLNKITQALDAADIPYRVEDRKVVISAEHYDQARTIYSKLHVGPVSLDEIRSPKDLLSSLVETPQDREKNERLHLERLIEHRINDLEGVISSEVSIRYPRPAAARHLRAKPTALVTLETEPNRLLPSQTLDVIPTILTTCEPELTPKSIWVIDRDGHIYLDPSNPKVGDSSRDRAREEEVRQEILEKLVHIKGVQVWVQLIDRHDEPSAPRGPDPSHAETAPAMGVNEPITLEETPSPTLVATNPTASARIDQAERGRVLITVPRSYYYNHVVPKPEEREPTQDELRGMTARTRDQIVKLVTMAVPESWKVEVETLVDDGPIGRQAVLSVGAEARRKATDWGIVAVVAAAVALVTALASWFQAVRRPARSPEPEVQTRRYRVDSGDEPNPSDRVRELVRRDPEAAASVLQRWTTQGGPVS